MLIVARVVLGIYALLLIVGGVIGYRKAGSRPSLIAGVSSGVVTLLALALTFTRLEFALGMALGLAVTLAVMFGVRLRKTGKFMPSGMLLGLSVAVAAVMVATYFGG